MEYGGTAYPIDRFFAWVGTHKKPILRTLIIAAIIGVVIFTTIKIINLFKNAQLIVLVAPTSATIKIDGREYKNGNYKFFPGKKKVEITHDLLEPKTLEVELKSNENTTLQAYLVGKTSTNDTDSASAKAKDQDSTKAIPLSAFDFYKKDSADFELLKLIGDKNSAPFINHWEKALTLRDILPLSERTVIIKDPYDERIDTYVMDGTSDKKCSLLFCLAISSGLEQDEATELAKRLLEEKGYNLNDYEVIYR